ncbi:43616_t:CDS:1, partial [Gigaspora margarita]
NEFDIEFKLYNMRVTIASSIANHLHRRTLVGNVSDAGKILRPKWS